MTTNEKNTSRPQSTRARWLTIYRDLHEAIIAQRVLPGTKLPEDELSAIYSVSRGLVRPALQALAHDNLIRLEPNRGAFVAQPSKSEARDVFAARAVLEPQVAAEAARASTSADIRNLRDHLEREHEAVRSESKHDAIAISASFHNAVAGTAGNEILSGFVRDLLSRSSLIVALYWRQAKTMCDCNAHTALVDAIEAHQPDVAHDLMAKHIEALLGNLDLSIDTRAPIDLASALRRPQ